MKQSARELHARPSARAGTTTRASSTPLENAIWTELQRFLRLEAGVELEVT